ncbi:MAG: sugar phosphate isomerase/epimerase family protein [Anaerolineae bacterium]|jgi:sugar phosphate isomerase/epimerase|nr:sugar phosphate isomerase/epimerase [Chloroflexota bacterium]
MKLGMLTGELRRATAEELFAAVEGLGFSEVQLELEPLLGQPAGGMDSDAALRQVAERARAHGVAVTAVGGTYNMIHPDAELRQRASQHLTRAAIGAVALDCPLVTLCTGTRNTGSMWRWHDDNLLPAAWDDLLRSMEAALEVAERHDLLLGIETEASNVVNTPEKTRRLLDTFATPRLKVIMDVANLFQAGEAHPANVRSIIDRGMDLLGADIQIAHGKDILEGDGLAFTHAGNGIIDWAYFAQRLREVGYTGGMLVHGIKDEGYFPGVVAYMRGILQGL